jgi:WD40 repeat protein
LSCLQKKGLKIDHSEYEKKAKLEMVLQNGHSNNVSSVSCSPDGKLIASGS